MGFVGVSFFFWIDSGFIIAYVIISRSWWSGVLKRQFWVARIARILSIHIATLLGVACATCPLSSQKNSTSLL